MVGSWYDIAVFKRARTRVVQGNNVNFNIQQDLGNGVPFNNPKAIVGSTGFVFNTESKMYNNHHISGQNLNIKRFRTPMAQRYHTVSNRWVMSVGHTGFQTYPFSRVDVERCKMIIFDIVVTTGRYAPTSIGGIPDFFEPNLVILHSNGSTIKSFTTRSMYDWYDVHPQSNVYKSGDSIYEESRSVHWVWETNGDFYGTQYKITATPLNLDSYMGSRDLLLKLYSCTYYIILNCYITYYYESYDEGLVHSTAYVFEG